jgi:probable addiction module antidote protein
VAKKSKPFDAAEYLETDVDIAAYLTEALETENMDELLRSIGVVAKARGMSQIANETGLSRESLYKALSGDARPQFDTVLRVLKALRLRISVEPDESSDAHAA